MRSSDDWDPEWIEYIFTCRGECSNKHCKQPFAISGKGEIAPFYDEEHGTEWHDVFRAHCCIPMPNIINVPKKCPLEVEQPLLESFSLFWAHPEACATRIRVSLEHLMSHLGIPKRRKTNKGKFMDLSLHGRLDMFSTKNSQAGIQLMALKWLGNAGSHEAGNVSKNDLLDAYEIYEHALAELIDKRSAQVTALAKKLTKKHGK